MTSDLSALRPGDRLLDRFRIDAAFRGGLGLLWATTDTHTGRRYAIKTVKPEHRGDAAVVAAFRQEALTWIALDRHPHLVQALWLIEQDPGPFLVLEFVTGRDLERVVADNRLPLARALDLAMQCAAGLQFAHTRPLHGGVGVVHRDLKPSNLLVTARDVLKVTDFGLARVFGAAGAAEGRAGTPAYMAPEQLRGVAVDGRADIYSFGLVVHEMLTGKNPLRAKDLPGQIERALHVVPPPLDGAPAGLAALVARCVAKDPSERPRDFEEVLGHLARVARTLEHDWHVDPRACADPARPTGLVLDGPRLRPRRPRTDAPFLVEVRARGDVGPGPVDVTWTLAPPPGLRLLTPGGVARTRVEAGGTVAFTLRHELVASAEGGHAVKSSRLEAGGTRLPVPAFVAGVSYAFGLPWAGRDDERAALEAMLDRRSGALFVRGAMGLGKTRLLAEAAHRAAARGIRVVRSRAHDLGMRPMRILNDLARALLGLQRDEMRGVRAAIHELLGADAPAARYFAEVLLGGVALEPEVPLAHRWSALLEAAARREPLVLLLDDLHHADEAAIAVVLEVVARAQAAALPVVVVGATRTGEPGAAQAREAALRRGCAAARARGADVVERELTALDIDAVRACLDDVFPGHGFAEEAPWLLDEIVGATRGNPFHVAEILRVLRHERIERRGDEWRLPADLDPAELRRLVPAGMEAVVRRRLDALPAKTRPVVTLAALVGEEFDARVVRAALGGAAHADEVLAELEEAEVVAVMPGERDRYWFWSAAVPAVVAQRLRDGPPEEARRLHGAVADAMLRVYRGEHRVRRALGIAHHLRAAGRGRQSIPFTLGGCERLLSLRLEERARRLLANAEPLVREPDVPPVQRAYFHYLHGLACEATGDHAAARRELEHFLEMEVALPKNPRSVPRAHVRLARVEQARGRYARAEEHLAEARARYETLGDRRKLAFVVASMADLALERGQLAAAQARVADAEELARETGNEGAAIHVLLLRGRLALVLTRLAEARQRFQEAEARAQALGDAKRRAFALRGVARVALASGYLRPARTAVETAIELEAQRGDRAGLARSLLLLGEIALHQRAADEALRHFRRAQRVYDELGRADGVGSARHHVGRLLRAGGKTSHAIEELAAAAEAYERLGAPDRFGALRDLGLALADSGHDRPARIALARADRGEPAGAARRRFRVVSHTARARLAALRDDRAGALRRARRAVHHAGRTTGHDVRIAAQLAVADAALHAGELHEARRAADTVLAFAREEGDPLAAAAAEVVLAELAARAGRLDEAAERAHRAARAYTARIDAADAPARLLLALGRGLARTRPRRAAHYLEAARRCYRRLEDHGFKPPRLPPPPAGLRQIAPADSIPQLSMPMRRGPVGEGSVCLSFSANMRFVRPLRHFISALCVLAKYDEDDTESIALVTTEILNNSIEHGAKNEDEEIDIVMQVTPEHFRFEVVDPGRGGADFAAGAVEQASAMPDLEEPRGRGLFLIKSYMDTLDISYDPGRGTCFRVSKAIGS